MENNRLKSDQQLREIAQLGCTAQMLSECSVADCMQLLEWALSPRRPVGLNPEGRMRVEARVKHLHQAGFL